MQETQEMLFSPWVRKIPWSRKWQPIPIFLPGESHEQRSRYSLWGHKRDMTKGPYHAHMKTDLQVTTYSLSLSHFYLLDYSCFTMLC